MFKRLVLVLATALSGVLGGCAGLQPVHPSEFSSALPGNVLAHPEAMEMAQQVSAAVPAALQQIRGKLGHTPQHYTILVCGSDCFQRHVPVPGAAAAQAGSRIFVNADLVRTDSLQGVLAHEFAHVVIEELRGPDLKKVPEWANEGIAVWASGVGTEGCGGANERLKSHPVCMARTASAWLDNLAPPARRCWLSETLMGLPKGECPAPALQF